MGGHWAAPAVRVLATKIANLDLYFDDEDELQTGLSEQLRSLGYENKREKRLPYGGAIDLVTGRIGIECKIAGGLPQTLHQLLRYAANPILDGLVLATSVPGHARVLESWERIGSRKPLAVAIVPRLR